MTSSWFFLSTLNYDARSTTHHIDKNQFNIGYVSFGHTVFTWARVWGHVVIFFEARSVGIPAVNCLKKVTERIFLTINHIKSISDLNFVLIQKSLIFSCQHRERLETELWLLQGTKMTKDKGVYRYDFTYYGNMRSIIVDRSPLVFCFFKCGTMRPVMEGS